MTAATAAGTRFLSSRLCAAVLMLGLTAPASAQSISDKLNSWLFGPPAKDTGPTNANTPPAEPECPGVEIRQGASTLAINAPGADPGPMNTRYQVTIGQIARECAPLGGVMNMKVGVQGRVLLGPAGVPGQVDLPLRIVVVLEGADPKPIVSKFARVAVAVAPGQTAVPFMHVQQDLSFPLPPPSVLENYVVYIGFDPDAAAAKAPKAKKGPAPAKRKPQY
jgi:hypothetical protein